MQFKTLFALVPFVAALGAVAVPTAEGSAHTFTFNRTEASLSKRQGTNARLTWYDITTGTTACGGNYQASDYVVALDSDQFGSGYPGPNCGRQISITAEGQTTTATIVDECPGCPDGGLDLTEGLFSFFADPSVGVITGSWNYVS